MDEYVETPEMRETVPEYLRGYSSLYLYLLLPARLE